MTKHEAWETIAAAFALAGEGGKRERLAEDGLCFAPTLLYHTGRIDLSRCMAMRAELDACNPGASVYAYWWPINDEDIHTSDDDHERAMLAQLLAELAKEEEIVCLGTTD